MPEKKRILVCPLNWGLGHATRDIPIIRSFINHNFDVVVACDGASYNLLNEEFSQLEFIRFPGYTVRYSKSNSQVMKMFFLIPKIIIWTFKENKILKHLVREKQIDVVFSDNRFGLWNKSTYNIFMTHQLKLIFPKRLRLLESIYQQILKRIIKKYDECWIPDLEKEPNLSGELSHSKNNFGNKYFIGALSQFAGLKPEKINHEFDVLFILSGPEPQRSLFERIIYEQTKGLQLRFAIVRGTAEETENKFNFPVKNLANTLELLELITKSKLIFCRAGYSSVMDLIVLKKKAILVPTPGQTEQEYLAKYLIHKKIFYSVNQNKFNLEEAINKSLEFPKILSQENNLLEERIIRLQQD